MNAGCRAQDQLDIREPTASYVNAEILIYEHADLPIVQTVDVSGTFSFYSQPKSHGATTIVEFIEKAMEHSRSGKFLYFLRPRAPGMPPAPVQLLYPVSRFRSLHTLQHLCRFVVVRHVRRDLIDRLPVPPRLKVYLKETQYYIECFDDDGATPQPCADGGW